MSRPPLPVEILDLGLELSDCIYAAYGEVDDEQIELDVVAPRRAVLDLPAAGWDEGLELEA